MKKISIFLLALSLALTLCACSLSDKIPSLEEIVENGAEWGNEQLQQAQGCTLADLEKVWGKADGEPSGMYGYFWKVNDTVSVNVYYHKNAEIEHISVTDWKDGNNADEAETTFSEQPNYHIVNIVDRTKTEGLPYDMAEEKFFEDGDNEYYFSGIYSHYVIVHYEDGNKIVNDILKNPIYTGDLVQGRRRVKSYKVHQIEAVPEEEWVRVPDTHEAIITHETFDRVQALLLRDTRTAPKTRELHLFSGFLKCADCGKAVTRSQSGKYVYYACSTYKNRSRTACSMHSIKHNRLEAAVLFAIQYQVSIAVSYSEMIARINSAPLKKSQSHRLNDQIAAKEKELTRITRYKQSLYQDWKDGEITQQEYRDMKADYERQVADLTDLLARLNAERAELSNGVGQEHPALVAFAKYQNIEKLTREILIELVDHIKVYENGNISVKFKFADEFRKIAEYIEINTSNPAEAG